MLKKTERDVIVREYSLVGISTYMQYTTRWFFFFFWLTVQTGTRITGICSVDEMDTGQGRAERRARGGSGGKWTKTGLQGGAAD